MARLASNAQNVSVALSEVSGVSGSEKVAKLSRQNSTEMTAMPRIEFLLDLFRRLQRTP